MGRGWKTVHLAESLARGARLVLLDSNATVARMHKFSQSFIRFTALFVLYIYFQKTIILIIENQS